MLRCISEVNGELYQVVTWGGRLDLASVHSQETSKTSALYDAGERELYLVPRSIGAAGDVLCVGLSDHTHALRLPNLQPIEETELREDLRAGAFLATFDTWSALFFFWLPLALLALLIGLNRSAVVARWLYADD